MNQLIPIVDQWYQDSRSGSLFEIVAIDRGTIQVQYEDGEIADIDVESWQELQLLDAAAPEDWRSPFELDSDLDLDTDTPFHPTAWSSPLTSVEPETMLGVEDL